MDMPAGYYNRYVDSNNYDEHLFIAGPALQSAELNEIQARQKSRLKAIADSLFRDGDIVRDAVVIVNPTTGTATCSSGAVYLRGAVRGVPAATLTIPTGTHSIGIYLVDSVVDATTDTSLKDPASGQLNYQRSGAARLKVQPVWGYDTDGTVGDFFPIYIADDRVLRPKTPPPTIDAVAQSIAKYDRDSTGGSYIVRGMEVSMLPDSGSNQVYSVAEGACRANGQDIEFATSRRLTFNPAADLKLIQSEPHVSAGASSQLVTTTYGPIASIQTITITKQVVETVTHGAFAGVSDALANTSVLSIVAVNQGGTWGGSSFTGGTTYTPTTDYTLTGNSVNWSPAGAEPASGSTYTVVYQYIATVTADSSTDDGFYVTGAVTGTLILVTYNQKLPRIDRICVNEDGQLVWLKGVATNYNPRPPMVPVNMLGLASVQQTWRTSRPVTNDAVKVVPMADLARLNDRIDYVLGLVAQARLESSANLKKTGIGKGVLTDPFLDDTLRDAGVSQTGAIIDGILTLPVDVTPAFVDSRPSGTLSSLSYNHAVLIQQTARTGSMLVNPYMAFAVPLVPATAALSPATDRWTDVVETFKSRRTRLMFDLWRWWRPGQLLRTDTFRDWGFWWKVDIFRQDRVGTQVIPASTLRQISIAFTLNGFTTGETLTSATFDGVTVTTAGTAPANGAGQITGTFTIPANIPAGAKDVVFTGSGGHVATATFVGEGVTVIEHHRIRNRRVRTHVDPLAETFTLDNSQQATGVDLWFTAKGTSSIEVQIRETANGFPTNVVLSSARLAPAAINLGGASTRFVFDAPLFLTGEVEYAIVVLSDDAVAACSIAELGKQDPNTMQWVTAQPYQVGVLLSSSNATTWTAHQDRDLAFALLGAAFTQTTRTISLGSTTVTAATDLAVRATLDLPTDAADVKFLLTLPDSSVLTVGVDQSVRLAAAITGTVSVQAVLTGTASISPILFADVQLLWGVIGTTGTYYSRYILSGTSITAKVVVEVFLPGSSSITVDVKGDDDGTWTNLTSPVAVSMDDGWVELTYVSASRTDNTTAVRLTLSGSTSARPAARNLRMLTQ
ncbi:MAG: DUF4815 domain-containing protein [Solirubrobacterales bacterium]|jgi:hypothetical protein